MGKELEIDVTNLEYGLDIFRQISDFKPYSSYSFQLTEKALDAIREVRQVVDWGMGKNMAKMKDAALTNIDLLLTSPGERVNINLTEYECKSIGAVASLVERSLDKEKDGLLRK